MEHCANRKSGARRCQVNRIKIGNFLRAMVSAAPFILHYAFGGDSSYLGAWENFEGTRICYLYANSEKSIAVLTVLMLFFAYSYISRYSIDRCIRRVSIVIAVVFALIQLFGNSYNLIGSWDLVVRGWCARCVSLTLFAGYTSINYALLSCIYQWIYNTNCNDSLQEKNRWYDRVFMRITQKNGFVIIWAVLVICWLPYLIITYPGTIAWDTGDNLRQFFGYMPLYANHMVAYTGIVGCFAWLGYTIGNPRLGFFVFTLLQYLFCAGVIAYALRYIAGLGRMNRGVWLFVLLGFALLPVFPAYTTYVGKDTLYSALLFAALLLLIVMFFEPEKITRKPILLALFGLCCFFACIIRANGIFVVVLSAPVIVLCFKQHWKRFLIVLVAVIAVYSGYSSIIKHSPSIEYNTDIQKSAVLRIMLMQTARTVCDNEDSITEEARVAIDRIIAYDQIGDTYNAEISDALLATCKPYSSAELHEYYRVWFHHFFLYPDEYAEAFISKCYGYFYPENISREKEYVFFESGNIDCFESLSQTRSDSVANRLSRFYVSIRETPMIGLCFSLGAWNCAMLAALAYQFSFKSKRQIVFFMFNLITLLVCIDSPVNNYFRYGLPTAFMTPILILLCFLKKPQAVSCDKQESL